MEPEISKSLTIQHWRSLAKELAIWKSIFSFMLIHSRVNTALSLSLSLSTGSGFTVI